MKLNVLRDKCGFKMESFIKTVHLILLGLVLSSTFLGVGSGYAEAPFQWEVKWIKE